MEKSQFSGDVEAAVATMRRGGVILYPTDTVWGIGCDATCAAAVARIYAIKRRDDSKALISLVDSPEMLAATVGDVPPKAYELISESQRPLTIVYDRARNLAPNLAAADGSVGLRLTRHDYSAALCSGLGRPVVSTSVNRSGEPAARTFAEIPPELIAEVDYVALTGRDDNNINRPSRVVKVTADGTVTVLRS